MRRRRPHRARGAGTFAGICAWLACLAVEAQTAPPPEPSPPIETPPASAPAVAPATPPPAPATPPATPAPATAAPPPAYPYPYYPYPYPQQWYPPQPQWYAPPPPRAPAAEPAAVAVIAAPAPPPGSARTPADDPQADRGVVLPTAYTHPKGTFFISNYDLVFFQLGYAFTDDTQISLTGVPPIGDENVAFIDVTLKTTLYRGPLFRFAALGSTSGLVAKELGVVGIGRVGGVAQFCLEERCRSSLSVSSNVTLAGVMLMANGANGIFHMSRSLSLLAELDTLLPLANAAAEFNGAMAGGGLRFHWAHVGFDLTLMRFLGGAHETLPLLAVTYRS